MKIIKELNNISIIKFIEINYDEKLASSLNIISWQDGDGFLDICNEDFGIDRKQMSLFKEKNKHKKFQTKSDLLKMLNEYIQIKSFSSKKGKYKLGFNIYIWIKDFCLVLSPELNCGYLAKLNFFDKYVGFSILREPWDNKIFNYWEAQDTQKQNMHT